MKYKKQKGKNATECAWLLRKANATLFLAKFTFDVIRNNSNVTSGGYGDSKMQITSSVTTLIAVAVRNCSKNFWARRMRPVYVSHTIFDGGELCAMKQSSLFSHIYLDTTIDDRTVSVLHVKTAFYKLIVSVIFTTGTFYDETSDTFSLRQKRQL